MKDILNQLKFISHTIEQMFQHVDVKIVQEYPVAGKMSVWEVCIHLSQIPKADLLIQKSYTKQQMATYYKTNMPINVEDAKIQFITGIEELVSFFEELPQDQWSKRFTTYWGSEYSRLEWLIQIVTHLVHHRAQLYQYLLLLDQDIEVVLFR
ncbi:DinB family protein [Bacillus sp. FJAT-22090]|uniref:DinB family protein n=1 Tax=Bacillus sp. FJAT-22090 TaxID=1581038 RepID=UPI0011A4C4C8|nr:DinB family protein [Bacillus sp. FJAT-22090]